MRNNLIAVDADDTIFDENTAVRLFHNDRYSTKHTEEDYLAPGVYGTFWTHIWNTDEDETIRRYEEFIKHKLKYNLSPLPGALEVLQRLKKTHELVVVTSRDKRSIDMTHEALERHYSEIFKDVHFVPLWGEGKKATKALICNEIGAQYLIDDSYEHCKLAAESGVQALLFGAYGWNSAQELPTDIVRVQNWSAVAEYFNA